jgi:hypothetical protein
MKHLQAATLVTLLCVSSSWMAGAGDSDFDYFPATAPGAGRVVSKAGDPLALRLEDGTLGKVTVEDVVQDPNVTHFADDYIIRVLSSRRETLAAIPLEASYSIFQLTVADIVGGPGEEILVVSQQGRGSTVLYRILQIYSLEGKKVIDRGHFGIATFVTNCAFWNEAVIIPKTGKPMALGLARAFYTKDCPQEPELTKAQNQPPRSLRFSEKLGSYEMIGESIDR